MEEETENAIIEIARSLKNLKCFTSKESIDDLNFLKVSTIAKKLGKNENDTRELMRSPNFPCVPDEKGDLKVEEQAFIDWCRNKNIKGGGVNWLSVTRTKKELVKFVRANENNSI